MKQKITMESLELSIAISDVAHGIGTLTGISRILKVLKHADIDVEKLIKIIEETERRLASAQGILMQHFVQEESEE